VVEVSETEVEGSDGADVFAQLAVDLYGSDGVTETVETVVQFALNALDCTHAWVVFSDRRGPVDIAAMTDPVLVEVYETQLTEAGGPFVVALSGQETVLVHDTLTDQRWPQWAARVRELGVRSVLDVPMNVSDRTVGVLGLYSARPDAFDADDEAVAQILARHAAVALATARHEETIARAIDARKLVGQAMGILMERYQINGDQAFAILRRYSQDTNTKLRDIAQRLIDDRALPGDPARPIE
jgi:GAF domain-containing protein